MYSFCENNLIRITKNMYWSGYFQNRNNHLALIKITKSPYQLDDNRYRYLSLALIKITKSPYHSN